jgi:hypothetical protein
MRVRTKLDYLRLIYEIQNMNQRKKIFKVLKNELGALGYWKNKKRGNPSLGYSLRGKNIKVDG